ncbi:MAG: TonB-dependent receptor, partial [Kordiimonadaceae bacterium]|nr:TonB-dependent receptor [Kordiimonadaceae bacterium]
LSANLIAQETTDVIVTTATRYEKPISDIGSSISVISAEDLELKQITFLQDALSTVPGVSINQNGSFGGISSLRIRGAKQVTILIDGVQVNDPSTVDGSANFANYDVNAIERVEVLRGPQSILYGSDAMGGVINVISKSGEQGFGGSAFIEGGSFNTLNGGANIYGGDEKLNYSLSARGITSHGISKADENDGNSEQDAYRNISIHSKVTGNLSEIFTTDLIARYSKARNEFDSFGPVDGDGIDHSTDYLIASRNHLDLLDGKFTNTFSFEYSKSLRENEADLVKSEVGNGDRLNVDYFGHYKYNDALGLSVGLQHEETKATSASPEKFNIDSIVSEISFQGIENLTVTGGGRYDHHNQYGDTFSPRLTAAYYLDQSGTKVFANWAEGFKAPSVFQLTYICSFCGLTEPNPDLKPEETKGWEIGVEQEIISDDIIIGATYFDQKVTNLVDFSFTAGYDNIAQARTKGFEIFIDAVLSEEISFSANYTYTDAVNSLSEEALPRVPRNMAYGEIRWQVMPPLNVSFSVSYNDKTTDPFSPDTDSWTRTDFRATYQINEMFELYGRIDNLFNVEYQQVYGYGTADRSGYIGARAKF